MKALTIALIALAPLIACTQDSGSDNRAAAATENAVEIAATENAAQPPAADNESAAPGGIGTPMAPPGEVPIRNDEVTRPGPPDATGDQCGAARYRRLVGQPRSAIPAKPAGATWRITCTGCPITMDHNPSRLNIFYDSETERIDEVRCG